MKFFREVRSELAKVTWPTGRETTVTTIMVLVFATVASLFFLLVDWIIQGAARIIFGFGAISSRCWPNTHEGLRYEQPQVVRGSRLFWL